MTTEGITIKQFQRNVFNTMGIKTLVWIDDFFSIKNNGNDSHQEKECIETIKLFYENEDIEKLDSIRELPDFQLINFEEPWPIIELVLKDIINTQNIDSIVKKLSSLDENFANNCDLSNTAFKKMTSIFKEYLSSDHVHTLSLKKWQEKQATFFKRGTQDILFLVDLDFSDEQEGANKVGEDIIKTILPNLPKDSYCLLFSHEIEQGEGEENKRQSIIKEIDDQVSKTCFSVLSKKILDNDDGLGLDYKISVILQRLKLRKTNAYITNKLIENIKNSLFQFSDALSQQSIYELERVIFDSSEKEGISELDSLIRLINIKQKQIVGELLTKDKIFVQNLWQLRNIRKCSEVEFSQNTKTKITEYNKKLKTISKDFIGLRRAEIFDETINLLYSPLACGDIFSYKHPNGEESKYILLAQPCDLMLRSSGKRKLKEAIFIPIKHEKDIAISNATKKTEKQTEKEYLSFSLYITKNNTHKDVYKFLFDEAFSINIDFLDFCVYNKKGNVCITSHQILETLPLTLLTGWERKYEEIIKSANSLFIMCARGKNKSLPKEYNSFSLESDKFPIIFNKNKFGIKNFKRIKRLNEPYIKHLLHKYHTHTSRVYNAHDFTS